MRPASRSHGNINAKFVDDERTTDPMTGELGRASLRARSPSDIGLAPSPVMPAELSKTLNNLKQRLSQGKPNDADFKTLDRLSQDLHAHQRDIEQALREYPTHPLVAGLCVAALRFLGALDVALHGKAKRLRSTANLEPMRDKLPLCRLDLARIESLCLGVSALLSNRSRQPFPHDQINEARASLASAVDKLMCQVIVLGGAPAMRLGVMLAIHNLIRRAVTTDMLDLSAPQDDDDDDSNLGGKPIDLQRATRDFCQQVFAAIAEAADKQLCLDNAHDLGKCAAQVEMLYDYDLHGQNEQTLARSLEKILTWLTNEASVAQMLDDSTLGAFSSVLNLVKRFQERGMLAVDDRKLDGMWVRLLNGIANLGATRLATGDVRTLTACANLLRTLLDAGFGHACRALKTREGDELAAQFDLALRATLSAVGKLDTGPWHDLHSLSNLFSFLKACAKHCVDSGGALSREDLSAGAKVLATALPHAGLAGLRNVQCLGGLFTALGYLWRHGLLPESEKPLRCLMEMLKALALSRGWDALHAHACVQVLIWLHEDQQVDMKDLQAVLNRLWGEREGGWSAAAMLARFGQPRANPAAPVLQLHPDTGEREGSPRPRSPRLVGETELKPPAQQQAGQTWRAAHDLVLAKAPAEETGEFRVSTRIARTPVPVAASIFPIMVQGDPEEDTPAPGERTQTGSAGSETDSTTEVPTTTTDTTRITTTATTTATTTRVTQSATTIASAPERPEKLAPREEGWRLARQAGVDPVNKLLAVVSADPGFRDSTDQEGHDLLWHLLLTGKPLALTALLDKTGWQPLMSDALEQELVRAFQTTGLAQPALSALEIFLSRMPTEQAARLRAAMHGQPSPESAALARDLVRAMDQDTLEPMRALLDRSAEAALSAKQLAVVLMACVAKAEPALLALLLARPAFQAQLAVRNARGESLLHIALQAYRLPSMFSGAPVPAQQGTRQELTALLIAQPAVRLAACQSDVDGSNALQLAMYHGYVDELRAMLGHSEFRALLPACTIAGSSALIWAVRGGKVEVLAALVAHTESRPLCLKEQDRMIALEWAAKRKQLAMVKLLLEDKRAHRHVDWSKRVPLVATAAKGHAWTVVRELLTMEAYAADAGRRGPDDQSALYHAVAANEPEMVRLLLTHDSVRRKIFEMLREQHMADVSPIANSSYAGERVVGLVRVDALCKAVEEGYEEIVDIFLGLPECKKRLIEDEVRLVEYIKAARLGGFPAIAKRFEALGKEPTQ